MSGNSAPLRVGIIGCGLIGDKRAKAIGSWGRLTACADRELGRAEALARPRGARAYADWRDLAKAEDVDLVIIATAHDSLAEITLAAVEAGKHVLVEKPAARRSHELAAVIEARDRVGVKVHVGFNHRYHRSLQKARELISGGGLGELMFLRARYGHGGRIGYEKEWRADPKLSGGGELIDQGPHLIDLSRWFLGEFAKVDGFAHTYFWDMPVDDNAFMTLRTAREQTAFLHVSCSEWKNLFSMEIYGRDGKIELNGLGGSYGVERITFYKMLPEMGPPETYAWEYPMADNSWSVEMEAFARQIQADEPCDCGLEDAKAALEIVEKIYEVSGYDYRT
ncbi:LmbZ [Rhodoblastus sphagnicola]|uniref:LmbZ n=1 Tax=Rhodoblastus sphagnicola TaxID=333368 RepID=A0A2S6ND12_9HYPH|nr:Gfo/Idh/MocA family oxidoreductase [Rhodoblastus sphagnicola]MBB4198063.1 putative dehydrogenase [Rhodoblastus sphagnicola]PPQ32510.1 LmbZ [Rhodoblastus sphagnicola]